MKRVFLWLIIAIIVVIVAIIGFFLYPMFGSASAKVSQSNVVVTEQNFPNYLSSTNLVTDLPSGASILLKTEKKTYAVQKGSVTEGSLNNPDITITIPSSYIPKISNGFCSTMQEARNNGDLKIQVNIGTASVAFKYRALYKYKSCLGI